MKNFRATTRSGTVYDMRYNRVLVISSGRLGNTSFTVGNAYSSADPQGFPWTDGDQSWVEVEIPVVGERLAVVGLNEWRISTEIMSVQELDVPAIEAAAAALSHLLPSERYRMVEDSLDQFILSEQGPDPIESKQLVKDGADV